MMMMMMMILPRGRYRGVTGVTSYPLHENKKNKLSGKVVT